MAAAKTIFSVLAVVSAIIAVVMYNVMYTPSTWERYWQAKAVLSGQDSFTMHLVTYRVQTPVAKKGKKITHDNELRYVFTVDPGKKIFAPETVQFLKRQANAFPHLFFRDRKNHLVADALPIDLQPVMAGTFIEGFRATGTRPYPDELARANDWTIIWAE